MTIFNALLLTDEQLDCQNKLFNEYSELLENKYKELAEQIKKDSFTVPSSGKTICSPWRMRNLLKNCVTVSFVEKENNWNWKKYCMIKNVVAGKSSVLQTHNIPQHLYPEKNR